MNKQVSDELEKFVSSEFDISTVKLDISHPNYENGWTFNFDDIVTGNSNKLIQFDSVTVPINKYPYYNKVTFKKVNKTLIIDLFD
jgi:hypothetical protein